MWKDNERIMEVFSETNEGAAKFPCKCPICQNQSAHIYIYRHNEKQCGVWTWCNECGVSSHMSGEAPTWWKNPDFVDEDELCSDPEYLNSMADKIDNWVNHLIPREDIKDNSPFVMENRFNVILKENIKGLPAETTGVIIIRDNFKTLNIDFITADGKTVAIDEAPETLLKAVEVIHSTDNHHTA